MQTRTAAALHSSRSPSPRSARIGQLVTLRGAEGVVVVTAGPVPAVCFCFLIAAGFAALSGGDARQGGLRVQHRPPRVQHDGRLPVDFGALTPSEYLRVPSEYLRAPVVLRCKTRVNCRVALEVMHALCAAARAWRLTGIPQQAACVSPAAPSKLCGCRSYAPKHGAPHAASAPGLGLAPSFPHLHRDWACPLPHLHRDWARPFPHLHRDYEQRAPPARRCIAAAARRRSPLAPSSRHIGRHTAHARMPTPAQCGAARRRFARGADSHGGCR